MAHQPRVRRRPPAAERAVSRDRWRTRSPTAELGTAPPIPTAPWSGFGWLAPRSSQWPPHGHQPLQRHGNPYAGRFR
jgi:hypothetical protein